MSNKIVPQVYRAVIDDVIASVKAEFEEYGVSEDVLAELHNVSISLLLASCRATSSVEMAEQSVVVSRRRLRVARSAVDN